MKHPDPSPSADRFELSGGALCLDFANSWGDRADERSDRLTSYRQLLLFAQQSELIAERAGADLARAAERKPRDADRSLSAARELRESLYRIFSARAAGSALPREDLHPLNRLLGVALSHRRLQPCVDGLEWCWERVDANDLRAPLWPIVESAATLLGSEQVARVRECDADDCNWLFLDRSRSRSRRWCSMESCGNRAKARRHYRRRQRA